MEPSQAACPTAAVNYLIHSTSTKGIVGRSNSTVCSLVSLPKLPLLQVHTTAPYGMCHVMSCCGHVSQRLLSTMRRSVEIQGLEN
jgi:hypothetical protein